MTFSLPHRLRRTTIAALISAAMLCLIPALAQLRPPAPVADESEALPIAAAIIVAGLQSALIVALVLERRRRVRSQRALVESAEREELAGASVGVGFWTWEPTADTVWTTHQCGRLLGVELGEGLTLEAFLAALRHRLRGPARLAFEQAVRNREPYDGEWAVTLEGGTVRWIAVVTRPSGHSLPHRRVTGVLLDVTARRAAELQAEQQRHELSHLGRLVMLAEMSGALAHELRQPLMTIRAYAQGLLRRLESNRLTPDDAWEGLKGIVAAEEHAVATIDRTRALLKRSERRPELLDLNDVVRQTLALVAVELRNRGVHSTMQLEACLPAVAGDRIELQQVLLNVVLNACDAMNGVRWSRREVIVATTHDEEQVHVAVRDAGSGIPAERLDCVFEPFVTTKRDGLGLGLAICRSIVRSHRGEIHASNNPGGGATMRISLPSCRSWIASSSLTTTRAS
jgi:C4-dicarboxylate-specific signal transduction histidine kinase